MKLPTNFMGYDGKKELEKIENEKEPENNLEKKVNFPIISFSGDLSFVTNETFYKEIINYLDKTFPAHQNVLSSNLKFEDNVMKGSNTYIATAVDMYLKSINSNYRLATQLDLEQNLKFTADIYNDSGLALRNLGKANKDQAIYLFNQLRKKGLTEKDFPLWFNLRGLNLDNNLNFNLTDESFYEKEKCLNWKNGTSFSKIDAFGLPKEEDKTSSRQIWTSDNALSGCYLGRDSDLGSGSSSLSSSGVNGRVVLAKPKFKKISGGSN